MFCAWRAAKNCERVRPLQGQDPQNQEKRGSGSETSVQKRALRVKKSPLLYKAPFSKAVGNGRFFDPKALFPRFLGILDAAFLLTIGSFLLAMELFYLQLTILAFLLTILAFLLAILAFLLTILAFLLTMGKCV